VKEFRAMPQLHRRTRQLLERSGRRESERGQLLVIFALALTGLIGMVGLIIDGGDTALQRRDQQNVADAAAMAAGYALVNGMDVTAAAQSVAAANGYVHGVDDTTVTVNNGTDSITVDVSRPHKNYFSGLLGFASWPVSATASVVAGVPNVATGLMPVIFNQDAYNDPLNRDPNAPGVFGEPPSGTEDVPQDDSSFNWTVFCVNSSESCNADSSTVEDWIDQEGTSAEVTADWVIAPLNAGAHTTLYDAMAMVVGSAYPVAIVDDDGTLLGWAYFHVTGSVGGSSKELSGWFEEGFDIPELGIIHGVGAAGLFGGYTVELID
jgi:Flp pilus assembly protein TadG